MRKPFPFTRRSFLSHGGKVLALGATSILGLQGAYALAAPPLSAVPSNDPRLGPRILGNPKAPVLVQEWFSLTCTHCAHFALEEFPQIKKDFIDTGKIRFQFHDFPMDGAGLLGAMVARALPPERYLPFIDSLFSHQMKWLFAGGDPVVYLQKIAALAGISQAQFNAIRDDKAYAEALYNQAHMAEDKYHITGTPYFRFNAIPLAQDPGTVAKFAEMVAQAARQAPQKP